MATEIYIGTEQADCSEDVAVLFSGGDIRDMSSGRVSSSFTIGLPLTDKNRRLLHYNDDLHSFEEVTETGYVFKDGQLVLKGKVIVTSQKIGEEASVIINGNGWTDHFEDKRLQDLDLSAYDHEYNATNIEASWSGAAKFYRYPMIWFARLFSEQTGSSALWLPNDFLPMFRVADILSAIFAPFTLAGQFLTDIAELYILGKEQMAEEVYIQNKAMDVKTISSAENETSDTIGAGVTKTIYYPEAVIDFNAIIANEQSLFSTTTNRYTVLETGTHRFIATIEPDWVATDKSVLTVSGQNLAIRMYRLRGGVTSKIYERYYSRTSTDILHGITYTCDTYYMRFEEDDEVWVTVEMDITLTNTAGGTQDIDLHLEGDTEFELVWNKRCLNYGVGANVSAEEMLPDVSQIDFVKAIKEAFNLRFTPDYMNQVVYIESLDRSLSSSVRTITKADFSSVETENIAQYYASKIRLKLKCDTGDRAVNDYLLRHSEPYVKQLTLASEYARKAIETMENSLFAYTQIGQMFYASAILMTPRIWGTEDYPTGQYFPEYRTNKYQPRLLWWNGLTSGVTWNFNGTSRSAWPKSSGVDMTAVYSTNFLKSFHLIDRGKILKMEMPVESFNLQEFVTVVNDIDEEGFRTIYELSIGNNKYYCYLNRIEFRGSRAFVEMIIKH